MTKLMGLIAGSMSSSSGGLVTILETIASFYLGIVETIYTFFVQLVWLIMQFLLLVIDFIFVFVRHITGINVDFSDIGSLEESDILFQFMFSDAVMDVLKAIIVMAIVMIILFAIIGILKNEYLAATTNANNSKKQIMVSALKSVFMIILIPVIMIGSVFLSNAVLSALYNVTSGGNNISMGTEVFLSSTYQANVYRDYATSGKRIPITYDFSEDKVEDNIGSWADGDTIAETEEAYLAFRNQSVWQRGLSTYSVFLNGLFEDMDYIEEADKQAIAGGEPDGSAFHLSYDAGIFYKRDEYYQMGEAIDHAMRYGKELFFKTPQEITESWSGCLVDQKYRSLFTNNSDSISFSIKYTKDARATVYNAMDNGTIQDEAKGSVFLVCVRATDGENDYFAPLLANTDFYSSITEGENVVIAKGVFDEGKYPTAIRSTAGVVECYRDKVNAPYFADLFPKISYELPEGVTQNPVSKILKNGLSYIAGVDDIDKYIPYVYYNFDLWNLFGKTNRTVSSIDDGGFVLNYAFNDDDVRYDHFFSFTKTNIIVLVFCGIIIFGMLIKSVFGVTARVFDLVLLWIAYPAVCATMSIDGGGRFKGWTKTFTSKLFSVYSLVLGINLVLLLFPIIERIEIFSAADIQQYIADGLQCGEAYGTDTAVFQFGQVLYQSVEQPHFQQPFVLQ